MTRKMNLEPVDMAGAVVGTAQMNSQGRVVIPAEIRKAMGLEADENLMFRYVDGRLTVQTIEDAVAFVQAVASEYVVSDGSMVDDLIAERRAEAAREW